MVDRGTGGRLIDVASVATHRGSMWQGAYSASKIGIRGLTQSVAQELAPHGTTANVSAGAHYAGAGGMEYQRRRSLWKRYLYRVIPAQHPINTVVSELNAFDPGILTGYPSVLELLAEEQQAGRLRIRPVVVELAGESVDDAGRARITEGLGGALHDVYSASEFLIIPFDCTAGRLHVNSDWAILEPVDEHYRPTPPGERSYTVLLTNLANAVQPLIRYDLGDSVLPAATPCRCGSTLPTIRVQGRAL